jgi:hypothetical protein
MALGAASALDIPMDVDMSLISERQDEFADVFERNVDATLIGRLSTVCRAFKEVAKTINGRAGLRLDMNECEAHGMQGHKPVMDKYKKVHLQPRMVVPRHIPTDADDPHGATFLCREDVPFGSAVDTEATDIRVDLMVAGTNRVREKGLHCGSFFFWDPREEKYKIKKLNIKLGKTLSRHDSPHGVYELRMILNVGRYNSEGPSRTFECRTPPFGIVTRNAIPTPGSDKDMQLLKGGGKRSRHD